MALVAPDLRPRGAAELYDAAVHLATRGQTPLSALALAGAAPAGTAGLALGYAAVHGRATLGLAAAFALLLMLRGVFAGAACLAAEAALAAEPMGPRDALRRALSRAPSLMAASGFSILIGWIALPATLFSGFGLWAPLSAGMPMVARGDAGPFTMGRICRKRLARSPALGARALHALATAVVGLNLHTGLWLALYLGRALMGLDVAFLEELTSPRNPVYLFFLAALTLVLLEPVRLALGVALLVDAQVRSEGLDLAAAVERLSARRGLGAASAALLIALAAAPTNARAAQAQDVEDLHELLRAAGLEGDARAQQGLAGAKALEGPDARALHHFVQALRAQMQEGDVDEEELAGRLREGLAEARAIRPGGAGAAASRAAAQAILAGEEFDARPLQDRVEDPEQPEKESWLVRLLDWLFKRLREKKPAATPNLDKPSLLPGLGGEAFRWITYGLAGLAAAAGLFLTARALQNRSAPPGEQGLGAEPGPGAGPPDAESALSREPSGWWSQADALAARGDFREAVRALYLAVLAALHRRGAIDYDPAGSNGDYVRAFKGDGAELPPFRELTVRFDFAWYGRRGADAGGYAQVRSLAGPLIEPEGQRRA
jgi:hypothetical protein